MPPRGWQFFLLVFAFSLALLIRNTAAGFTSRLAGGLAFAASAILCAFAKISGFNSFDMFHSNILHLEI
jgi:hypothetical protein